MPLPHLLVLAPLGLEAAALGPGGRVGGADVLVKRSGMGLAKAAATAARLGLAPPRLPDAVALAGLGGALGTDLEPGDVVVADRVLDTRGGEVAALASASLLAHELRHAGLRARTGTVVSADHIVTGRERATLAALGADVVDMESAAIAAHDWHAPLAVVRAISDSPGQELFSVRGALGVARALRSLRSTRQTLARWAAAAGRREVVLVAPRSFCAGVRRAIETVERALELYGPPVYVRRQIVHNAHVVNRLQSLGAVFVEELREVPDGARVVFSAHGVGTAVIEEASRRSMHTVDATCPLVTKVHNEARRFATAGRQVVLIGHAGHDEVEGTLGTLPGLSLVCKPEDVARLELDPGRPTAVITQTTLATDEVSAVVGAMAERFADLARPAASDICYASQNRQEAVRTVAPDCDVVLVVGSANSSNANRLVEVARRQGPAAYRVDSKDELRLSWVTGARRVGVTAGASVPEELVDELVSCLAGLGPLTVSERTVSHEHVTFSLPAEVR
ncbi:MAG TPA: 4-hydroxy-3-methylbut-2-enyl diphosphate reductase [Acidimicrobiales bacterium]|nr:4-hydroxy-3-methylbut-2-enyl diphosphate reductase [Acidimicrobiales bacterium]